MIAGQAGVAALRAGRAGLALAALHLGRRSGTHRIVAVLAVAVAVFTTATLFWQAATVAWGQRAAQELGAPRVLVVQARGAAQLLAAVRAVDPEGRYAMAVARTEGARTSDRVVAVDSARLARVANLPQGDLLHPPTPEPPMVTDGRLSLDVAGPTGLRADESVSVRLHLSTVDGVPARGGVAALAPVRRVIQGDRVGMLGPMPPGLGGAGGARFDQPVPSGHGGGVRPDPAAGRRGAAFGARRCHPVAVPARSDRNRYGGGCPGRPARPLAVHRPPPAGPADRCQSATDRRSGAAAGRRGRVRPPGKATNGSLFLAGAVYRTGSTATRRYPGSTAGSVWSSEYACAA